MVSNSVCICVAYLQPDLGCYMIFFMIFPCFTGLIPPTNVFFQLFWGTPAVMLHAFSFVRKEAGLWGTGETHSKFRPCVGRCLAAWFLSIVLSCFVHSFVMCHYTPWKIITALIVRVCVCDFDECMYIVIWPLLIHDNIIYTTM